MSIVKRHKDLIIKIVGILIIVLIIVAYIYLDFVNDIFNILIISYFLASILNPLSKRLSSNKYINYKLAAVLVVILSIIFIAIALYTIIPIIFKEINNCGELIEKFKVYIANFEESSNYKNGVIVKYIYDIAKEKGGILVKNMSKILLTNFLSISNNIISYAVIPVVTYYFISDREKISKKLYKLVPYQSRSIIKKIVNDCNSLLGSYLLGQLFLSVIIGILTFIILLFLDVKFPLVLAVLNGLMNIIPYFGPIFGAVPIVAVAFLESTEKGIWILICLFIIQQIEGNILSPKITAHSTDMHPLWIIILLILGENVGGFLGMIIAVPIGVILKVIYEDINYYIF